MWAKRITTVAALTILCLAACQKRPRVAAYPPPAPPAPAAARAPAPPPSPPPSPLEQADRAFSAGGYEEAGRAYEEYAQRQPTGPQRDQALFRLGLISILRTSAPADWPRATGFFKQVIDEYPASPLKPAASLILSLRSELDQAGADAKQRDLRMRQLSSELDRLKKIDADRRRRP